MKAGRHLSREGGFKLDDLVITGQSERTTIWVKRGYSIKMVVFDVLVNRGGFGEDAALPLIRRWAVEASEGTMDLARRPGVRDIDDERGLSRGTDEVPEA